MTISLRRSWKAKNLTSQPSTFGDEFGALLHKIDGSRYKTIGYYHKLGSAK